MQSSARAMGNAFVAGASPLDPRLVAEHDAMVRDMRRRTRIAAPRPLAQLPTELRQSILTFAEPGDVARYARTSRAAATDARERGASRAFESCCAAHSAPPSAAELWQYVKQVGLEPIARFAARLPQRDVGDIATGRGADGTPYSFAIDWVAQDGAGHSYDVEIIVDVEQYYSKDMERKNDIRVARGRRPRPVPLRGADERLVVITAYLRATPADRWQSDEQEVKIRMPDIDALAQTVGVAPPSDAERHRVAADMLDRLVDAFEGVLFELRTALVDADPHFAAMLDGDLWLPVAPAGGDAAFAADAVDVAVPAIAFDPWVWNWVLWRRSVGGRCRAALALDVDARHRCVSRHALRYLRARLLYGSEGDWEDDTRRRVCAWILPAYDGVPSWCEAHLKPEDGDE